jgi:carboxypeptidase C (cathepsin A)
MISSEYDIGVTAPDPFPLAPERRAGDPILDRIIATSTSAITDFVVRVAGWKVEAAYVAISYVVNAQWNEGRAEHWQSVGALRRSLALDSNLRVLIAHGWTDLACPVMSSILILDQMPQWQNPGRLRLRVYPGGHMFYTREASAMSLHRDVKALYEVEPGTLAASARPTGAIAP